MSQNSIILSTAEYVRKLLTEDKSGHDWWHVYRVWNMARKISIKEDADLLIVELAALLHDIADWKFHDGDISIGPEKAKEWLDQYDLNNEVKDSVSRIIRDISFRGANEEPPPLTLEGKVVQDADRLDAMGAIGIARAFSYGGNAGRIIYDPDIEPILHDSARSYLTNQGPSINHFYEKLLLLKDLMNTNYGKQIAIERHRFMKLYLDRFYEEWDGKL
ncbi:MAG: HD domain-containing protein [candidate division Zixibacteria bacterium]|nr:HD domain-containing protein [candidate division Zixibacteria bacterium]